MSHMVYTWMREYYTKVKIVWSIESEAGGEIGVRGCPRVRIENWREEEFRVLAGTWG